MSTPRSKLLLYDVLCALHATADIVSRATVYQAERVIPSRLQQRAAEEERSSGVDQHSAGTMRQNNRIMSEMQEESIPVKTPNQKISDGPSQVDVNYTRGSNNPIRPIQWIRPEKSIESTLLQSASPMSVAGSLQSLETPAGKNNTPEVTPPADTLIPPASTSKSSYENPYLPPLEDLEDYKETPVVLKASKVPSSRIGRLFHYGSLAAGLTTGAATEFIRRQTSGSNESSGSSLFMSEANVARLVDKLSQMRGAALKLGQFMSIQDAHTLPDQIEKILRQVQNMAHYMPNWQMEAVMSKELGPNWKSHFDKFDAIPIASASIGQVHTASLSPSSPFHPSHRSAESPGATVPLAIKIQFPNVEQSIVSDIKTLTLLLSRTTPLMPKGLFMDSTLKVFKQELAEECDYLREGRCAARFGELLADDKRFRVPRVFGLDTVDTESGKQSLTTSNVLVMELMEGIPLGAAVKWEQEVRDEIARNMLVLCLKELFQFRLMQTDPNWSNFLYNRRTRQIELVDFGASREYSKEFMDRWYLLLEAAISGDRDACIEQSLALGYLTGQENETMINAHVQSMTLLGIPFSKNTPQPFSFTSNEIPMKIRELIPVMLQHRLTPPPRETYSLNRKLGGTILLCGRLRASVDCRSVWEEVVGDYKLG
ncbi:hypothetical protein FRC03_006288 [Tulasnella sp. 419]|nr:hypothetical protein FRC03_006288 [Tulasnella sp. 419]